MKDIEDRVGEVIMSGFPMPAKIACVRPEHDLVDDLLLDSLDLVSLAIKVEDEFRVQISDDMADGWRKVSDVVKTIKERLP